MKTSEKRIHDGIGTIDLYAGLLGESLKVFGAIQLSETKEGNLFTGQYQLGGVTIKHTYEQGPGHIFPDATLTLIGDETKFGEVERILHKELGVRLFLRVKQ